MLNENTEKQNSERLIIKDEISIKSTASSPFESTDDMVLSGNFSKLVKDKVTFRSRNETLFTHKGDEFISSLRENQIRNVKKDLTKSPENPFLLNNLGLAYLGSGELDKALELFNKAIEIKHDFTTAKLNLASIYTSKNKNDLALQIYQDLLKRNPKDIRALINVGDIYFKIKELEKAKAIFEEIIKENPNNIASRNKLAAINLIQERCGKAISELRKCLQVKTDLPSIYNNLGVAYGIAGSYKKAILSFKIALKLSRNYSSAIANLATVLGLQNRIQDSIELIEDYLKGNENYQVRELLSEFYLKNKQFKNALKNLRIVLTNAIKLNFPNQEIARLYNNIGVVHYNLRDFNSAEENFTASLNKAEYVNQIQVQNLIDLYFFLNNINKAKKYIDILREKFGEKGFYLYYMGLYSFRNKELSNAIVFLKDFINVNKKFAPSYTLLGYILSEYFNDFQRAIEVTKEGYENIPDNIGIINNLAYDYLMNNEVDNAKNILDKVKGVSDYIFLIATRGLLKIKEGNLEEGRRLYNLAEELAEFEFLKKQVIQKKHLEIAKYFLAKNIKTAARDNLLKVLSVKIKESIYTMQANELYGN